MAPELTFPEFDFRRQRRRGSYEIDPFSLPKPSIFITCWSGFKHACKSLLQHRILRIPKLNLFIIIFFGAFLVRLMFVYRSIYEKTAITTMIVSNLLLYGLADTLAQSLTSFVKFKPETGPDTGFRIPFLWELSEIKRIKLPVSNIDDNDDDDELESGTESSDTDSIDSRDLAELGLTNDTNATFLLQSNTDDRRRKSYKRLTIPTAFITYDFRRLALFMVWGFVQAILQYYWYPILNSLYNEDNLFLSTLKRVMTDQLCFSPLSLAAFFLYSTIVIENGSKADVVHKLKTAYLQTLVVNYAVWPAAQTVNFMLMPKHLQVPFASTVGVFWNAYLSLKGASD